MVPSWSSLAMLMKFMQQEYFSGGRISCCFQMKTDKMKCFPERSVRNGSARSPAPFTLNVPPECYSICSEHLGESLANISQMTEPTEDWCWRMWEPLPAWGKMALCSLLIKQAFLSLLLPFEAVLEQKSVKRPKKGSLGGNGMKRGKAFFSHLLAKF